MKTYILLYLLIIVNIIQAQEPKIDLSFRYENSKQKQKHYQLLKKCMDEVTENQTKYDVKYYSLDLDIISNSKFQKIIGTTKIIGKVTGESINYVELNFWNGMTINNIYIDDSPTTHLDYTWYNDIVKINLDSTYLNQTEFEINISYNGLPQNCPYGIFDFNTHLNEPMISTLNEPFGARAWFPCKDIPSDKADSVDIRVTVSNNLVVASNGLLRDTIINGTTTTYWWHEQYPISTYLISLAIHPYAQFSDWYVYGDNDSMEVQYYVFPDKLNDRKAKYSKTVEMIEFFSSIFGQYPFVEEKYGHAEFLWGGGMEHQTLTSLGGTSESLIAHELAHQWWGDAVTCNSFHDLWLNEGFASYSEALWFEYAYPSYSASDYQLYSEYFGSGKIYIHDVENENLFHGGLRYDKASWVLHMLRHIVGDDMFFNILKQYYTTSKFQYKSATTNEFIDFCKEISQMNLDKFFQQWIFGEYYPDYSYSWYNTKVDNGYNVNLTINQDQDNTGLFWMPIDVKITTSSNHSYFVVMDSVKNQNFQFFVNEIPINLELDPDNWILKKIREIDSSIAEEKNADGYYLYQNYPNPFNPSTIIQYELPVDCYVELTIHNLIGEKISNLIYEHQKAGNYKYKWNGDNFASGVYFYKIMTKSIEYGEPDYLQIKKMLLIK